MLTLYPAALLDLLISTNSFLVEFLGFSLYKIIYRNFTFSFPIWMPFIYLSCLSALARTSSAMLNKNGKSDHVCVIPDLIGKSFTVEYDISCGLE